MKVVKNNQKKWRRVEGAFKGNEIALHKAVMKRNNFKGLRRDPRVKIQ